jgi:glycosyltransferase involved in cell wall biosynthesis
MTIFYFFYEYLSEGLGGLNHIWSVSKHLQKQGHRVVIFAPRCGTYSEKRSLEIIYVPTIDNRFFRFFSFHFMLLFYAGYYMIRYRVDILYVREMALSLTPIVLAKLFHKPMVTEINGDLLSEYQHAGYPAFILKAMRLVEMIQCRASHALVCVTEGLSDIFQNRYRLLSEKLEVIPNGTDPESFYPLDKNDCRKRLGIDSSVQVVGFIGTFVPHQGLSYLIESSSLILKELPEVNFLLVGDGPMRKKIIEMIRDLDLEDQFFLPGGIPSEEASFFINAMDVCVAPFTRIRNERIGLSPIKVYDYLACGKPVVASDIIGVGDILTKNKVGIAVPPEDLSSLSKGIISALKDRDMADRCLREGPSIVRENFTWQITAQRVAAVCLKARK